MVLECWCQGSNDLSMRSPVVGEERMRPGYWLGLMLAVLFSALTLMAG